MLRRLNCNQDLSQLWHKFHLNYVWALSFFSCFSCSLSCNTHHQFAKLLSSFIAHSHQRFEHMLKYIICVNDVTKQARITVRTSFIYFNSWNFACVHSRDIEHNNDRKEKCRYIHKHVHTHKSSWNGCNYRKFRLIKATSPLLFTRFPVNV